VLVLAFTHYTWTTSSRASRKLRKIDKVLVNTKWNQDFSFSEASFLAPDISNHTHMVVRFLNLVHQRKPFKFFDFWTKHLAFHAIVTQVWESPGERVPMYRLVCKLKTFKGCLKQLNRESFSNISARTAEARNALQFTQVGLQQDSTSEVLAKLEKTHHQTFLDF